MTKTVSLWIFILAAFIVFTTSCSSDDSFTDEIGFEAPPLQNTNGTNNNTQGTRPNGSNGTSTGNTNTGETTETNTDNNTNSSSDCTNDNEINTDRTACNTSLSYSNSVSITVSGNTRTITANNIPDHNIGVAGPNTVSPQNNTYSINTNPQVGTNTTALLSNSGPAYSFGILLNGVEVDPEAAKPWPHTGSMASANWTWNLEAMHVRIGLDCNNAHVQPNGQYHYHGNPTLLIESMNISNNDMTLIGYAADGFPIYFKYGYNNATTSSGGVKTLESSYRLKSGSRPGDGDTAPCGTYDGVYSNDFEYIEGLGDLDQCNGRVGVTPNYPEGTYYYVITDDFPYIPRCFVGSPSNDFRIGG
tara:strand:- start:227 stop:1306 length:1080 start_codon:yes stop_codon:yes gene_type:complete